MSTTILATKLYTPLPRPKIVLRPRLIERLNEGLSSGRKLTLISASAGFGKTTLVSEWIACCERPVTWLSLDEGDNDPARFLIYLVTALQSIVANIGTGVLGALQSHQPPSIESILTALLNEITTISDNFVLVLDDYHIIDSKPVDNALTFLLEHLPPQMHLVIATREDPQLPLSRLRARGQLTELRAADLRFTPAEAAEFLNQMMGLNLSAEDIAALETRTEGWIAGLQFAAISMQGHQDTASFVKSFTGSHYFVLDYLVEEVLQQQSETIQTFLLHTSILERLCGSLCDAVLLNPSASGQETLEYLERANLFIVPLDNERRWYRYHHLFGDLLRQRLQRSSTLSSEKEQGGVHELHRHASEWYEHNGSAADAIRHALAAEDFARAADLIELAFPAMSRERQFATLLGWLKLLPDEVVRVRPVLCYEYAFSSMSCGENESVEPRLQDAERWFNMGERPESQPVGMVVADQEEFRRLPGLIALTRGGQALGRGDMPETVKYAQRVLDLAPERDYLMLGGAAAQLGLVAWTSGDLDTARRMTAEGMENLQLGGYISPVIGCAITLADIQITQGDLHKAMTTYERGLHWATRAGAPTLAVQGAADMHVGMSSLHYEHNDLETATQCLLTSQALGELAGLPQNPYRWCAAMARIRQAQGDLDGAIQLLEEAERVYDGNFSPNVRPVATRKVRVWLAQGRLGEALDWARQQGLSAENELSYLREFDHIALARVLLARYQSDRADVSISGAVGLLERLLKAAEEGGRMGSVIEILVLQALAHQAQGDLPAALLPLQHALALAEPEGYVRMFLDEGPSMMQLLREASAREIMPDYTDKLLAAFEAEKRKSEDKPDLPPTQPLIDPLSQRELKILQLIAQGLSNREIGERLFLALDTIKGHNRKIFDKLQVQSRTEAIARARELGLL
ncbi:LuxR C-terminal-related transcriptional regulator [Candidatus Villigracilis affinis]|uniref:LuxR C-terminal-related transcriptional regulator n=1 Tax=Candidatus Villigracilis affinis TaxID=3140682 RepID=UPI001D991AA4|nr:helix-turn-helix transcriptional regulator [Anaerolineales bacterium]